MTTSTVEVDDLLSSLGAQGIERQLKRIVGVGRVSVNPVSGATTVVYDSAKTDLPAIEAAIKECGYHCAGEALPNHICKDHRASKKFKPAAVMSKAGSSDKHESHAKAAALGRKPGANTEEKAGHKAHGAGQTDAMAQESSL